MTTRIWVDRATVEKDARKRVRSAAIVVSDRHGSRTRGRVVQIDGPSRVVYLREEAPVRVMIETESPVRIVEE